MNMHLILKARETFSFPLSVSVLTSSYLVFGKTLPRGEFSACLPVVNEAHADVSLLATIMWSTVKFHCE